jgi:hypothetical protein
VRSERLLVEQVDYNLLFRWFVGLGMDDAVWNHAVFSKNRDRLLCSAVAQQFFTEVNQQAKRFMSDEHFTVDGTLLQAWASQKSFRAKDGSDDGDGTNFHGHSRSNETHESTTDADARLYKKSYGTESKLSYLGHVLVENRNGLIAAAMVLRGSCTPAIESAITGEIEGWDGETIFRLDNGEIWQQAEYDYTYFYEYHPDVTIYLTSSGCRMKVEGESDTVVVKRIK